LNEEMLLAYSEAKDSKEVVEMQEDFMNVVKKAKKT
jgi:ribosome biogenesis protein Tsr3